MFLNLKKWQSHQQWWTHKYWNLPNISQIWWPFQPWMSFSHWLVDRGFPGSNEQLDEVLRCPSCFSTTLWIFTLHWIPQCFDMSNFHPSPKMIALTILKNAGNFHQIHHFPSISQDFPIVLPCFAYQKLTKTDIFPSDPRSTALAWVPPGPDRSTWSVRRFPCGKSVENWQKDGLFGQNPIPNHPKSSW
jgi:hypothetical protein